MREIVIAGVARTPIGSFQGALANLTAPQLGALAIDAAIKRAGIAARDVNEVIMGNVLTAGVGQAPARQAARAVGIPNEAPTLTINKVCGSGMKAIMLAAQSVMLGDSEVVVAGGMESMSQAPFLVQNGRGGFKMGHQKLVDGMIHDGLWDPYNNQHMGNLAELCARENKFSREEQDLYATQSFKRAQEAQKLGNFKYEIVPVPIQGKKGDTTLFDTDEGPGKVQFDKISTLKPAFDKAGTVTAANASTINDGASAVVVMSAEAAKRLGVKPLVRLVSYGSNAQAPEWFTTAPAEAMRRAMKKANWEVKDVDSFEINEAFAVVAMAAQRDLQIPGEKMNRWGGAISLGHPIGSSGARIVVTLISQLQQLGLKRGIAGICIGGGEATALCVEKI